MSSRQPAWLHWIPLGCILLGFLASLGRACEYEFVWDDVPEIQNSAAFQRPLREGLVLTQVERGAADLADLDALEFTYDSYRPVTFASYWLDIAIWGRSPRALHRTNVVLGGLAIVLAFMLVRRWLGPRLASPAAALFALHPIQIETVAYVSARGDLLAGLFALGSAYAALRALDASRNAAGVAWAGLAVLAFAASLLAKESYLALPGALTLIAWGRRPPSSRRWWLVGSLFVTAFVYVPFRSAMVDVHEPNPLLDAVAGLPGLVVDSLRIFVLPFDLSIERTVGTDATLGWAVLVAVVAVLVWSWRRARAAAIWIAPPAVLPAFCWFVLLLVPSSVVVARTGTLADRYLYLPLLGVAICLSSLMAALLENEHIQRATRRALLVASIAWSTIVLAVAWMQVPVWRDRSSLYHHALAIESTSSRAHYRVAVLEIERDRWDVAIPLLQRAIELDPANVEALNNLGVYYLRRARPAWAEQFLLRAVAWNPGRFKTWMNLGLAQLAIGRREAGCSAILRALKINPKYIAAQRARTESCAR